MNLSQASPPTGRNLLPVVCDTPENGGEITSYSAGKLGPTFVGDALTSLETSDTKTAELFNQVGRKTASVGEISQA